MKKSRLLVSAVVLCLARVVVAVETPCHVTACSTALATSTFDWNCGFQFTANTSGLAVTALWVKAADNLSHQMYLYDAADGTQLATTTIAGVLGTWQSGSIPAVSLTSGHAYVVTMRVGAGNFYYTAPGAIPVTTGNVTINKGLYIQGGSGPGGTDVMPTTQLPTSDQGFVDVSIATGVVTNTPTITPTLTPTPAPTGTPTGATTPTRLPTYPTCGATTPCGPRCAQLGP